MELAGAGAELELIGLARLEAERLEREALEQASREAAKAEADRMAELQAERQRLEAKLDKSARAFARDLAAVNAIAQAQDQYLAPGVIMAMVAPALNEAGAPTHWIG